MDLIIEGAKPAEIVRHVVPHVGPQLRLIPEFPEADERVTRRDRPYGVAELRLHIGPDTAGEAFLIECLLRLRARRAIRAGPGRRSDKRGDHLDPLGSETVKDAIELREVVLPRLRLKRLPVERETDIGDAEHVIIRHELIEVRIQPPHMPGDAEL